MTIARSRKLTSAELSLVLRTKQILDGSFHLRFNTGGMGRHGYISAPFLVALHRSCQTDPGDTPSSFAMPSTLDLPYRCSAL